LEEEVMSRKRYRSEEIVAKLREADVLLGQGKTVVKVAKVLGVAVCEGLRVSERLACKVPGQNRSTKGVTNAS
jgi:hypothetical protein